MDRIFLSSPDVGPSERDALLRAFDSGWIAPAGPELDAFEEKLASITGWPGCVAMSSGTAALHLALDLHGVGADDDVFVSTFTFAATANAIRYCGANPVFIDSDDATWNMSPVLLAEALAAARKHNKIPKAVVVVDLYGQCADYDAILPQCHELGIPVIEDAAEALFSTYKSRPAGALADAGVFSFNGNKIATTSGGGAFLSPDTGSADRVRYLATQARQPTPHYEHTDVGYNYRLSNLLAAIGRAQLERLPDLSARRVEINKMYRATFADVSGISFMPLHPEMTWNGWLTCLQFEDAVIRDHVMAQLEDSSIESRPLWKPMHLQPIFADSERVIDGTSERLFTKGLCLPSGSVLTDTDVERISEITVRAVRSTT